MEVTASIQPESMRLDIRTDTTHARHYNVVCGTYHVAWTKEGGFVPGPPIAIITLGSFDRGDIAMLGAIIKELQEVQGIALDLQSRMRSFYNEATGKSSWTPDEERVCLNH